MSAARGNAAATGARADGGVVLAALAERPGGAELLAAARERTDLALVGGAVRDLLRERVPRELDVVLDDDAAGLAAQLAAGLASAPGGSAPAVTLHERFGTAALEWPGGRIDIAARRAESYPAPGALPVVRAAGTEADLARRDFTVNAIAVSLGGEHPGTLVQAEHALEDLRAGRLRVLHERSFIDDPTRLLRLARYHARLGFAIDARTAELAAAALAGSALASVSGARVGAELRLALREHDPLAALAALEQLGVLAALGPELRFERDRCARALALLPDDGRADVLLTAALLDRPAAAAGEDATRGAALLERLEFTAGDRALIARSVRDAPALTAVLASSLRASELGRALAGEPLEAVVLAASRAEPGTSAELAALEWLGTLRHVRLEIGGDALLAAGVPAGPDVGRRLAAALARRLDGELAPGAQAELDAALEADA